MSSSSTFARVAQQPRRPDAAFTSSAPPIVAGVPNAPAHLTNKTPADQVMPYLRSVLQVRIYNANTPTARHAFIAVFEWLLANSDNEERATVLHQMKKCNHTMIKTIMGQLIVDQEERKRWISSVSVNELREKMSSQQDSANNVENVNELCVRRTIHNWNLALLLESGNIISDLLSRLPGQLGQYDNMVMKNFVNCTLEKGSSVKLNVVPLREWVAPGISPESAFGCLPNDHRCQLVPWRVLKSVDDAYIAELVNHAPSSLRDYTVVGSVVVHVDTAEFLRTVFAVHNAHDNLMREFATQFGVDLSSLKELNENEHIDNICQQLGHKFIDDALAFFEYLAPSRVPATIAQLSWTGGIQEAEGAMEEDEDGGGESNKGITFNTLMNALQAT